ncbi:MAG: iron-containing alcohol dehydrogenase [Thiobacillaceae bacterium]
MPTFSLSRLPRILFGPGTRAKLPELIQGFGRRALLVTGARSFQDSPHWRDLHAALEAAAVEWTMVNVVGEPSPQLVDAVVTRERGRQWSVVVGIGGGSALDAAKAIAGLLIPGNSVMDHLEGVGPELPYRGPAAPFIAVPTTAGTGSEATKNAVLSVQGPGGFKKSFRDEKLMAEYAVVDPDLLASCPRPVLAANGMDAFTQLLESYVSIRANPLTDALARSGLVAARDGLLPWYEGTADAAECRARMAYAALVSGITLAQVGLGSVHGLASPLGAFFPIPHGVVCGTLLAAATRVNVTALRARSPEAEALKKYAEVGRLLTQRDLDDDAAIAALLATLEDWTRRLGLPRLSAFGVRTDDIPRIVAHSRGSSMKTNPIVLTDAEIAEVITARL